MTEFAIAGCQVTWGPGDNLENMRREIALTKLRFPWIDMVMFGELVTFGPFPEGAVPLPGPVEERYRAMAREHGVWLVPGSLYERDGDLVYNTTPVIDPDGNVVCRYRKIYPWMPYEAGVASGTECKVFDVPGVGRFGLSICYDMWFPETTRQMVAMGAEVILHPTMTNTIDREVELCVARASAVMFQTYFFDVNSAGGLLGYGRSIILGPDGEVLHQAGNAKECIPILVDCERVQRSRRRGSLGLGQPVKSFRDTPVKFPYYSEGPRSPYLDSLGPLVHHQSARRPGNA
jgi:predicted amidohydrolase